MSDDAPADAPAPDGDETAPDASAGGPFDLGGVRSLLEMMQRFDVSEIDLKGEAQRWHVRRGAQLVAAPAVAAPPPVAAAPVPTAAPAPAAAEPAPAAPAAPGGKTIDSPTVGTFYASPSPDDPPFVVVGDSVQADTVVCLVEAMKVFNQIQAETAGTIAEVLVEPGAAVEYGTPLFRLA